MATTEEIMATSCPKCGAPAGCSCILADGRLASSYHNERARKAKYEAAGVDYLTRSVTGTPISKGHPVLDDLIARLELCNASNGPLEIDILLEVGAAQRWRGWSASWEARGPRAFWEGRLRSPKIITDVADAMRLFDAVLPGTDWELRKDGSFLVWLNGRGRIAIGDVEVHLGGPGGGPATSRSACCAP